MFFFKRRKDKIEQAQNVNAHHEEIKAEPVHTERNANIPGFLLYPDDPVSQMMFESKMREIRNNHCMYRFKLYTDVADPTPEVRKNRPFAINETHIYSKPGPGAWYSVSTMQDASVVTSRLRNSVEAPDNLGMMLGTMVNFLNLPKHLEEAAERDNNAYRRVKMEYLGEYAEYSALHGFDESHVYCHIFYLLGQLYKKFILCARAGDVAWKVECTIPSDYEALTPSDYVPAGQTFGSFFGLKNGNCTNADNLPVFLEL